MTRAQFFTVVFHRDSIAFLGSIMFFWVTISSYIDSHYEVSELEVNRGILVSIDSSIIGKIDKPLFKETTKELYLRLSSSGKLFFVKTKDNFAFILNKLNPGDSLSVYTKPKVWGIFGLKKKGEICHLISQREILLDFNDYRNSISGIFLFTFTLGVFFLIFFIVRFNKRYYREVTYFQLRGL